MKIIYLLKHKKIANFYRFRKIAVNLSESKTIMNLFAQKNQFTTTKKLNGSSNLNRIVESTDK